jgi:hypothetical protein
MAENNIPVLTDKAVVPTDKQIFSFIGENKTYWKRIMNHISENYKEFTGTWNYYNDGKQWLFKLVNKKKTIFWLGLFNNTFRITFYFGDKAEQLILASELPDKVKQEFRSAKKYGAIRGITTVITNNEDVDIVEKLIAVKLKIK